VLSKILQWLQGGNERSPYPRGFYLRGALIAVVFLIPAVLGLRRWLETPEEAILRRQPPVCPPMQPMSLREIARHPERFQWGAIWVMGRLVQESPLCLPSRCVKDQPCCPPCRARLFLQAEGERLPLAGVPPEGSLTCQGTACKMSCGLYKAGDAYALYGAARTSLQPERIHGQPRWRLNAFWVQRSCKMIAPVAWRLPNDPLRSPHQLQPRVTRQNKDSKVSSPPSPPTTQPPTTRPISHPTTQPPTTRPSHQPTP
jgi:hypothetical protein